MKVIISGGGTGGHIFPAIAIANSLKAMVSDVEILFIGAKNRMEMEKIPAAGYNIEGLNISGLQRSLSLKNLLIPFKLTDSILQVRKIIKRFKPDLVIGTGGYASGPTLFTAAQMGIPTIIQEQNSYPGLTNRILAKKAKAICVAYPEMEKYFPEKKMHLTGNPIRQNIISSTITSQEAKQHFNLDKDIFTVLVVGGSLGALTINQSIESSLSKFEKEKIQLIWQTGKSFASRAQHITNTLNSKYIYTTPFIFDMDKAYAAADIVVSRSGAIAVSELCIIGKPVILVPSPNVAEDHQTKNAMALVNKNAARIIKDQDAREILFSEILHLKDKENQRIDLSRNILKLAKTNAADEIAQIALDILNKN